MLARRLTGGLLGALAASALLAVPAQASQYPDVGWPQLLPPFPVSATTQPGPMPYCKRGRPRCVTVAIRRMKRRQAQFGCDHRAVFTTTYIELSKVLRRRLKRFRDPRYLAYQVTYFAGYYFRMLRAVDAGRPIPEAWRIAIDTAAHGDVNAAQDMLLGINAHVQRDMPFVVAGLGLVEPSGRSRKADHDLGNEILNEAYEPVVRAVEARFDPQVGLTNAPGHPLDDAAGMEMVKGWREGVWRNAERLVNAKTPDEYRQVVESIELNAANTARMIAGPQQPGYRAQRDAYCHSKLG